MQLITTVLLNNSYSVISIPEFKQIATILRYDNK